MSSVKRLQFSTVIDAPPEVVWRVMLDDATYRRWTEAFAEGSHYEGSWAEGERIRFLVPSGDGMVAEIAERREHEFLSIRHLGVVSDGVEDTDSEAVRAWAPAHENYTFEADGQGTRLVVEQEVAGDYEQALGETWGKALESLKILCEDEAAR